MTDVVSTLEQAEEDARWHAWRARGAEEERQRIRTLRIVCVGITAALSLWWFVQLVG